jgi:hypothetical protein
MLSSGTHTITAEVTDSGGKAGSTTITVVVNGSPAVSITSPADGAGYEPGEAVTFEGMAPDLEDGDLGASITWTSDLDGALGSGGSITTSALVTSGTHTITAEVTDSGGKTGSAAITVVVNASPTVSISSPPDGAGYEPGEEVSFEGTASDLEDGDLGASITWTSDLDGPLGTGSSVSTATLSSGTNTITAEVTDSGGKTATSEITLVISP